MKSFQRHVAATERLAWIGLCVAVLACRGGSSTASSTGATDTTAGSTADGGTTAGQVTVELQIGDLAGPDDNIVIVTDPGGNERPYTPATVTAIGGAIDVDLSAAGTGVLSIVPDAVALAAGTPVEVRLYGDASSAEENDSTVRVQGDGVLLAEEVVSVVTGIKIAFTGTFGFAVSNDNGARASSQGPPFTPCGGDPDPEVWRTTPLPCEPLNVSHTIAFDEATAPQRWPLASGKRPEVAVAVSGVKTFGPAIDLTGRDPALDVGAIVSGQLGSPVGELLTDDCDDNPNTGEPDGRDQGVEPILGFGLAVGKELALAYQTSASPARTWTTLPPLGTPEQMSSDNAEVMDLFLPAGESGCTSPGITYFDSNGVFQCNADQTLRELLLRYTGFRSAIRLAWANWTSRSLAVSPGGGGASFAARLFMQAAGSGQRAEAFIQLGDYDWYTLVGRVHKGVLSTPGGISERFEAWTVAGGCPVPREPDDAFDEDPFAIDP